MQRDRRAFRLAYGTGLGLCVVVPLAMQAWLHRLVRPAEPGLGGLALDLGYTFTGLVALSALYAVRRARKAKADFSALAETERPKAMAREILLQSALFAPSALFGVLYYAMGGPQAERYGRSFLLLTPLMFLLFVPRLQAWREAGGTGSGPSDNPFPPERT